MGSFIRTLGKIDLEMRQIAFKNFDRKNVNLDLNEIPLIRYKLKKMIPNEDSELTMTPISRNSNGIRFTNSDMASLIAK